MRESQQMDMKSVVALFILIQNYHSNFAENILNIRQKLCIMKKQNKVYYFRKR